MLFLGIFFRWPGITRASDTPPLFLYGLELFLLFFLRGVNPQRNN